MAATQRARGSVELILDESKEIPDNQLKKHITSQFSKKVNEFKTQKPGTKHIKQESDTSISPLSSAENSPISRLSEIASPLSPLSVFDDTLNLNNEPKKKARGSIEIKKYDNEKKIEIIPKKEFNPSLMNKQRRQSLNKVEIPTTDIELRTEKLIVCINKFKYKPFGFSVASDEFGLNAIVTKVTSKQALDAGIKIGYCIAKIKKNIVLDITPHKEIVQMIDKTKLPSTISFVDRGIEYKVVFEKTPLGFSIMKDENDRNAKVVRASPKAKQKGIKKDSWISHIGNQYVWGWPYDQILHELRTHSLPLECRFRMTPRLKEQKNFTKN